MCSPIASPVDSDAPACFQVHNTQNLSLVAPKCVHNSFFLYTDATTAKKFTHVEKKSSLRRTMGSCSSITIMSNFLGNLLTADASLSSDKDQLSSLMRCVNHTAIATVVPMFNAASPELNSVNVSSNSSALSASDMTYKYVVQLCQASHVALLTDWLSSHCSAVRTEQYIVQIKRGIIGPIPPNVHPAHLIATLQNLAPEVTFYLPNTAVGRFPSRVNWKCKATDLPVIAKLNGMTPWSLDYALQVRVFTVSKTKGCANCFARTHTATTCTADRVCARCHKTDHSHSACPNPDPKLSCRFCSKKHLSTSCPDVRPTYTHISKLMHMPTAQHATSITSSNGSASPLSITSINSMSPSSYLRAHAPAWNGSLPPSIGSHSSSLPSLSSHSSSASTPLSVMTAELQAVIADMIKQQVQAAVTELMAAFKAMLAQLSPAFASLNATTLSAPSTPPATTTASVPTVCSSSSTVTSSSDLVSPLKSSSCSATSRIHPLSTPSTAPSQKRAKQRPPITPIQYQNSSRQSSADDAPDARPDTESDSRTVTIAPRHTKQLIAND